MNVQRCMPFFVQSHCTSLAPQPAAAVLHPCRRSQPDRRSRSRQRSGKTEGKIKGRGTSGASKALSARGLARHALLAAAVPCCGAKAAPALVYRVPCFARWAWQYYAGVHVMSSRDDDRFRVRPGAPKNRQQKFVSQVLKEVSKAGGKSVRKSGARPGARLRAGPCGRPFCWQHCAAGVAARRHQDPAGEPQAGWTRSTTTHLRYIERDGVGRDGERARPMDRRPTPPT